MKSIQQSLRYPDALVPNLLVLAYILLGYPGGWLLMHVSNRALDLPCLGPERGPGRGLGTGP